MLSQPPTTGRPAHLLWWFGIGAVAGLILGLLQPLVVVAIGGFGMAAGPSPLGLFFLLCVAAVLFIGLLALAARDVRDITVPIVVLSASLALGMFSGNVLASSAHIGWGMARAEGTAANTPWPWGTMAPRPVLLEAHATVSLHLEGLPDFVAWTTEDRAGDGLWGHWCGSAPNSTEVASVSAAKLGSVPLGDLELNNLQLAPYPDRRSPVPDVHLYLRRPDGTVPITWSGQGLLEAGSATSGRLSFTDLVGWPESQLPGSWPATLSGELTWRCGAWSAP